MSASHPDGIRLRAVTVRPGSVELLSDVTLELDAARIAVVGANGSGKSSLVRLLNGLVRPECGEVHVAGVDVLKDPREARRRVGMVFSNPDHQALMPTVREDVAFSLRGSGLSRAERNAAVEKVLHEFGLGERGDVAVHALSGGQRQLLALAAVAVRRPRVLVADEPTALLDLVHARRVAELLLAGRAEQLVLVTHDLALAARCDIAVLMDMGRVAAVGAPGAVIARYRESVAC